MLFSVNEWVLGVFEVNQSLLTIVAFI